MLVNGLALNINAPLRQPRRSLRPCDCRDDRRDVKFARDRLVPADAEWRASFKLADWHLQQIEADRPDRSSEQTIKGQIGAITVVRNTLALYTIACTLYIAWKISAGIEWPVLEFVLFPWS